MIDEIHSLDAYQNALTETLLTFHAAFGGSAVLVSATLTKAARQRWPMRSRRAQAGSDDRSTNCISHWRRLSTMEASDQPARHPNAAHVATWPSCASKAPLPQSRC